MQRTKIVFQRSATPRRRDILPGQQFHTKFWDEHKLAAFADNYDVWDTVSKLL